MSSVTIKIPKKIQDVRVLTEEREESAEGKKYRFSRVYEVGSKEYEAKEEDYQRQKDERVFSQEFTFSHSNEPMDISLDNLSENEYKHEEIVNRVQEAYDQGFADGQETTSATFRIQLHHHQQWVKSIDAVAAELKREYTNAIVNMEKSVADLAVMVSEHILEREVTANSDIVIEQAKKAVAALDEGIIFKIRMHPDNVDILKEVKSSLVSDHSKMENVVVTADESVDKGGCVLETSAGAIDASMKTQLDRLRQSLSDVNIQPEVSVPTGSALSEETYQNHDEEEESDDDIEDSGEQGSGNEEEGGEDDDEN